MPPRLPARPAASPTASPVAATALPDLPRQVMRRAGLLGALVLLLALVLGLARMGQDIDDEVDAAMTLAGVMARLGQLDKTDDRQALADLRALQTERPLRHLALQVQAPEGSLLLGPAPAAPAPVPLRWMLALHQAWLSAPDSRRVVWPVPRADGSHWTVSLSASHDSERREAMANLLATLSLLLLGVAGLLVVMHWNMRLAFAPLGRLLQAIASIEGQDARQVQALPLMPTRELESLATALRHLGAALDQAEAQRRQLSQQMLTLQEDERVRLARDLHDEFGQRLTALRVDAAWLARRLAADTTLLPVVDGMARQCALVQQDIRSLLVRLQPFGPASAGAAQAECLTRGVALLQALVDSWQGTGPEPGLACRLHLTWHGPDGRPLPWPDDAAAQALWLPRVLWLTLYRISQEALTNVARHAQASHAVLRLDFDGVPLAGAGLRIHWTVSDDGVGVNAAGTVLPGSLLPGSLLPRGNGIVGIQQRVWAQGADLQISAAVPGAASSGWRLQADFSTQLLAPPADTVTPEDH